MTPAQLQRSRDQLKKSFAALRANAEQSDSQTKTESLDTTNQDFQNGAKPKPEISSFRGSSSLLVQAQKSKSSE